MSENNIIIGTFSLKEGEFLYHGSAEKFRYPYIPTQVDNRFSPTINFPRYYATKRFGKGYVYRYKIKKEFEGIPDFLFLNGKYFDVINQYKSLISITPKIYEISRSELMFGKRNVSLDDTVMARVCCTKFNGLYIPSYENQVLICYGNERIQWLELDGILEYTKNKDEYTFKEISTSELEEQRKNCSSCKNNHDIIDEFIKNKLNIENETD